MAQCSSVKCLVYQLPTLCRKQDDIVGSFLLRSGGKDLKDTGAYPLPFAKRVIQEQRRLIAAPPSSYTYLLQFKKHSHYPGFEGRTHATRVG